MALVLCFLMHVLHLLSWQVLVLFPSLSLALPTTATNFLVGNSNITNGSMNDLAALLSFKSMVSNPSGVLASWNNGSFHFCQWEGVTCSRWHPGRVTWLDLGSLGMTGTISPSLANLTFLRSLDLSNNSLRGSIPHELGLLRRLRSLNLGVNYLKGEIPSSLSHCSSLQFLILDNNMLEGRIPSSLSLCTGLQVISLANNTLIGQFPNELASLSQLAGLILGGNNLTGRIPPSIANLSSLDYLDLSKNSFTGGIPPHLGNLSSLQILYLSKNPLSGGIPPSLGDLSSLTGLFLAHNLLSGTVPYSIYNLSNMDFLSLGDNKLSGVIPHDIGRTLPRLQKLYLFTNEFEGPIPPSFPNASGLVRIQLQQNKLMGTIPSNLGTLKNLSCLNLFDNQLEARNGNDWAFLDALTNCSNLQVLELNGNLLAGALPSSIGNLSSSLSWLIISWNKISGSIPSSIGNLHNLVSLNVAQNLLTGDIPASLGKLKSLHVLNLSMTNFSGQVPPSLGNITQLNALCLQKNALDGSIPASLGNCQNLQLLDLSHNQLTGIIPKEVLSLSSLSDYLDLSHNSLNGSIPPEIGSLINLNALDVSENRLSDKIPLAIGQCQELVYLAMRGNSFEGTIPPSLSNLRGLGMLDLSRNNFSGPIPKFLQVFHSLQCLNLSFNNLEGEVPTGGVFANASAISALGNSNLCGGIPELHLQPCRRENPRKTDNAHRLTMILAITSAVLCSVLLLCLFASPYAKIKQKISTTSVKKTDEWMRISYAELHRATNGFSPANLIGEGSFGSVYKGIININEEGEQVVAIKVINLQQCGAPRSFMAECEALKSIRHRNLVKIITSCSSINFQGDDFKALVFEFMPNGNLESWLHPEVDEQSQPPRYLTFHERMTIAIDVAYALDYLHNQGPVPVAHCDLKPSNVLLDDNMNAHASDFGLARFLPEAVAHSSTKSTSSIAIKGSIGYIAPEYGLGSRVSTQGDVYSYGILLLEMFTGKRPTDAIFSGNLNLCKYVEMALSKQLMDIVDPQLLLQEDVGVERTSPVRSIIKLQEGLASVFKLGLSCSKESPGERTNMEVVIKDMEEIRNKFLKDPVT